MDGPASEQPEKHRRLRPQTLGASNEDIRDFLNKATDALDREAWDDFLSMCGPEFEYRITAFSYELNKDMVWLVHDMDGLKYLFEVLPEQLGRKGTRLLRHVSVTDIAPGSANGHMDVTSKVIVIRTSPEGVSELFAAGRYIDIIDVGGGSPKLVKRETRLETRDLGPGSHVPI